MKLISLSDFHRMSGIGETDNDQEIVKWIEWVSSAMEAFMDRWLVKQQYTEVFQGDETRVLRLRAYPVDLTEAFTLLDYGEAPVSSDRYHFETLAGRIVLKTSVWHDYGYPTISVTYTGGYVEAGEKEERTVIVPDSLKFACFLQTQYLWRNRKELGLTSVSMGGVNVALAPATWLPTVRDILRTQSRITI